MSALITINNVEVEFINSGDEIFTTSLQVAEVFEKRHTHILDIIKALPGDEFGKLNFRLTYKDTELGGFAGKYGATRKDPYYEITRDGFSLLVMGFTGERAYRWKIDFLKAFNKMEEMLKNSSLVKRPHLDSLIQSVGELNKKLESLDTKNHALASELVATKDKYTALLEKQVSMLESFDKKSNDTFSKKGTHLSLDEISKINTLYQKGYAKSRISKIVDRSETAINSAIKRANLF